MKRNIKSVAAMILLGVSIFMISCKKDETVAPATSTQSASTAYYLDDQKVSENDPRLKNEGLFIIEEVGKVDASNNAITSKYAYTTQAGYIAYGEKNGIDFKSQLEFEETMSNYALTSGAIEAYEKTGEVPQSYIDFEEKQNEVLARKSKAFKTSTLAVRMWDSASGQGDDMYMAMTLAVMPLGWNNRVSCIEFIGLGGGLNVFDNNFYINRLQTIVNVGLTKVALNSNSNNKMSSAIRF